MENSLKRPLYIEFYGLPGSGKSTLSHIVARKLRSERYSVDEPSYDIDHQHPLPKRVKKFAIGGCWFVFHHKQYRRVQGIVKQNDYKGMTAFTMTVNVIQKMRIYNERKHVDMVFWDQGLIQACVSLSTNGKTSAKENYAKLLGLMPNAAEAFMLYINVDNETAMSRMDNRATNDSRVEKLKEHHAKMEMLGRIRRELESVREQCAGNGNEVVVTSSSDLTRDADAVYDAIKKYLTEREIDETITNR